MKFGNPTAGGRIQALTEPWDGTSIRVTRDCAGHQATNQGCALDLGDGKCTRPVLAAAAGAVTFVDVVQGIVRIDHGGGWGSGYAHMSPLLVGIGQQVAQGQQIGEIGDAHDPAITNFSGCHLHFAITLNGAEQDPWPYLNQTGDDVNLKGAPLNPIHNRKTTLKAGGAFVRDPTGAPYDVITSYQPGQLITPTYLVKGNPILGSDQWYGLFEPAQRGTAPIEYGYLSVGLCNPLVPIEAGDTNAAYNSGRGDVIAAAQAVPPK